MGLAAYAIILCVIGSIFCGNNITSTESTVTISSTPSPSTESTAITSPSTSAPIIDNKTKITQSPSSRTKFLNTTSYLCSCDLTFGCDVNCCCDIDCNAEITEAFDCSFGLEIDDFLHGEGLERCDVSGGLFCIAHDNVKPIDRRIHMPYQPEYSSYKWPKKSQPNQGAPNELSSHDFYKYGDAILTYDKVDDKYETISIPAIKLGDSSSCFLTESVMFLKSKSIQCLRSQSELCSYNGKLMSQLLHTRLFHRPPKSSQEMTEAFSIVIESCKHTFHNCTQISSVNIVGDAQLDIAEEMQKEFLYENVYEDIKLIFNINDTKIISAVIKFGCHNDLICSDNGELESTKIIQTIEVQFINVNENHLERRIRKKQRGYNDEELIVISRRQPLNESILIPTSNTEMIFDYFRNSTLENKSFVMKLPKIGANGRCILNHIHYDTIMFNENSHTSCRVELTRDSNSNFTICQQFQHQLMWQLFNTLNLTLNYTLDGYVSDVFVSKLWTPQYAMNTWTKVSLYDLPLYSPEMQENEKTVTCLGLSTSANYKFLYSTIKAFGARKYEHFIENLIVDFDKTDELQVLLDDENQTTFDIEINVQFVNLFHKNNANAALAMNNLAINLCITLASLASLPFW